MTNPFKKPGDKDRTIIGLVFLILCLVGALVIIGSLKLAGIQRSINDIQFANAEAIKKIEVKNGYTPIKGVDYDDGGIGPQGVPGNNAVSTHTIEKETVIKEVPIPGPQGPQGLMGYTGKTGPAGPALKVIINPFTCVLSTMYEGDDAILDVVKLSAPCEVL